MSIRFTTVLVIIVSTLFGVDAAGHAGGYDIAREVGGYLVEFELESEHVYAEEATLITVRLEDAETLEQVGFDAASVRITDAAQVPLLEGTFVEDAFSVSAVRFFLTFPEAGTYTADVRFIEGRGGEGSTLVEASGFPIVVSPSGGGQGDVLRLAAFLLGAAAVSLFAWKAFAAARSAG